MDDFLLDTRRVNDVWSRVTGTAPPRSSESAGFAGLIAEEYVSAQIFLRLSRRYRTLGALYKMKCGHIRLLKSMEFLRTGSSAAEAPSCPLVNDARQALRECFLSSRRLGEEYASLAGKARSECEKRELLRMKDDEEQVCRAIMQLIAQMTHISDKSRT